MKEADYERLYLVMAGHSAFQLLWAGHELGLFGLLSRRPKLTRTEIAAELGLQDYPCRVLLVGLAALGLVVKEADGYRNATVVEEFLVGDQSGSGAPILGWQAHIVYPGLQDFVASLKQGTNVGLGRFPGTGDNLYRRLTSQPALEQVFQDAMSALSLRANRHLLDAYDFGRFQHIVDAGGGDGTNAIALAKRFPRLEVTVYDSATVCEIARRNIAAAGLTDRVHTHVGDFLHDPFPPNSDGILFCHMLTIWSLEHDKEILHKAQAALPPGGAVMVFNMMGDDDDTGPLVTALGSPYFLAIATGEGMLHAWKDYEDAMREIGFERIERVDTLPLNHGLIVGFKAGGADV